MAEKKKVNLTEIYESICENLWRSNIAEMQFGEDYTIPNRFHVETSPEGAKRILEETSGQVMRYVSDDAVISAVSKWCYDIPAKKYASFKLQPSQVKNAVEMWKNCSQTFPHKIAPILQKSTKGYTYHRLDFDMAEAETPIFDHLISGITHNADAALSFIGALIDPDSEVQQYLWLQGPGGDGKGTLFRFLKKIFNDSYCAFDTEERSLDKYWSGQFVGKRLAICGDCRNKKFVHYTPFMQMTGGDAVGIREMQKTTYTAHLPTRFIFGANTLPDISSQSSDQRRAIICPMRRAVEDMIEGFEGKLWQERAGIIWKCWQAWVQVKGMFMIPTDKEYHVDLARDNEEAFQIIADKYLEFGSDYEESRPEITKAIQEEKSINFYNNTKIHSFYEFVISNYDIKLAVRDGYRFFKGCRLKSNQSFQKPTENQQEVRF